MFHWAKRNHGDAMYLDQQDTNFNGLRCFDVAVQEAATTEWDILTPDQVIARLRGEPHDVEWRLMPEGKIPSTWIFMNRDGVSGILQITGFSENPRGVKIRFKLITNTIPFA